MNEYLEFEEVRRSRSGRTRIISVKSKRHGDLLGTIAWWGPWRQYTFFPNRDTVFDPDCMEDITKFIRNLMKRAQNGHDAMTCEWEDCPECEAQ